MCRLLGSIPTYSINFKEIKMSNIEELKEVFTKKFDEGMRNFHVSWGPEAENMTTEERAGHMLQIFESIEIYEALSKEEKMLLSIKKAYVDAQVCMNLASYNRMNDISKEELEIRLNKIWLFLDGSLMELGNWIKRHERDEIQKRVKEQHEINNILDFYSE